MPAISSTVASGANLSGSMGLLSSGQFRDEGGEEVRGGRAGGGELRFQLVHQGHQLIHFGHDPALFGEWWEGDCDTAETSEADLLLSNA